MMHILYIFESEPSNILNQAKKKKGASYSNILIFPCIFNQEILEAVSF